MSGVYTMEGENGDVYVQEFVMASDGIAEFPRMTSGMLQSAYEDFVQVNAAGLYGVFSHFIHPDDILDEERGGGKAWQELLDAFCEKVELINDIARICQKRTTKNRSPDFISQVVSLWGRG